MDKEWWNEEECKYQCPECKSFHVYHYFERVCVYDWNDELVDFKDWNSGDWEAFRCDDCGYEVY